MIRLAAADGSRLAIVPMALNAGERHEALDEPPDELLCGYICDAGGDHHCAFEPRPHPLVSIPFQHHGRGTDSDARRSSNTMVQSISRAISDVIDAGEPSHDARVCRRDLVACGHRGGR